MGQTRPNDAVLEGLHNFSMGATCALLLVAALVFMRFYRKSGDRLFLFFSAAFGILGVNRFFFVLVHTPDEARTALYVVRLVAFALILYAIIDKNRRPRGAGPAGAPPRVSETVSPVRPRENGPP